MFPGIYEFRWDVAHLVFLGAFYLVGAVLVLALAIALLRSRRDLGQGRADGIRWHQDFRDLPASSRICRHALAGRVDRRVCPNEFDCRLCPDHERLAGLPAAPGRGSGVRAAQGWFDLPGDRLYHRGHAWVKREEDGSVLVGLDDLAARLAGPPDAVELPAPGTKVRVNGTAWRMRIRGCDVRILCPVDGEVVSTGGPGESWYLKVRPEAALANARHLLRGEEAASWMLGQVDEIQALASRGAGGASLADGGRPVASLSEAIPAERRDELLGAILLDP